MRILEEVAFRSILADYNPEEPRDEHGKWASGGGAIGNMVSAPKDRAQWPAHCKGLKPPIPPDYNPQTKRGWTGIVINPDPDGDIVASGIDTKGRRQYVYSASHKEEAADQKFDRVKQLDQLLPIIQSQNDGLLKSGTPEQKEHAEVTHLIMTMGLRPGSEHDTGANKQAYGATTLEGRHVVQSEKTGRVWLKFMGKKGVDISLPVKDSKVAEIVTRRSNQSDRRGQLFPNVSERSLNEHIHGLDSGKFTAKDFRTLLGTKTAVETIKQMTEPKTPKEYKKAVMEVGKVVAEKLGNTPAIAVKSYISPECFVGWRAKAGL